MKHSKLEVVEGIAYVTINRPDAMNALTREAKKDLLQFFLFANEAEDFRVIILTGEGDRAFCAGTDLKEMAKFSSIDIEQMLWLEHRLNDAIRHSNKPVIAAVNGNALGGGCLIPLICDYSVVSDSAVMGFPEIKSGIPASIEIAIVHKFVGLAKARELIYFGETFTPQEALAMGLVNRIVPKKDVLDTAKAIALKFMTLSPTALRLQKELVNKWIETDFVSAVETSIYAAGLAFTTGEPQTAINNFLTRNKAKKSK
ncbi:enoyl-CoA hydratase/isomerase family protein [Sphaerochaeta sp. PS]|uniref:enoyl-CoA hydratase/isomerase family protein n=1 Tax=Sphaerochaeta sp. PS TaxID=3076336 RepID=UPI0028A3C6E3|nr:enoyl-CoA hydratase/isomerase family protein [Sphaerochaeta sp. PS]MDT4762210.1 enoyl-CoA hydratase/isomerase family protein [Sphaerochaeta sp. PS]